MNKLPIKNKLYISQNGIVVKANGVYSSSEFGLEFEGRVVLKGTSQLEVGWFGSDFKCSLYKEYLAPNEIIFKRAIDNWGERSQLEMLQEEATELALATRKFLRINDSKRLLDLIGEIADVEIMIEQFKLMFPDAYKKVPSIKVKKIKRLSDRLDRNSFE